MPIQQRSRAPERHQVAQARRRAGLTQQQLAERVGAGRVSIARIEGGTPPSVTLALAIARALGESVEALFSGSER
jgi:DNA-binding XRE family transcriptional regulator